MERALELFEGAVRGRFVSEMFVLGHYVMSLCEAKLRELGVSVSKVMCKRRISARELAGNMGNREYVCVQEARTYLGIYEMVRDILKIAEVMPEADYAKLLDRPIICPAPKLVIVSPQPTRPREKSKELLQRLEYLTQLQEHMQFIDNFLKKSWTKKMGEEEFWLERWLPSKWMSFIC